MLRDVKPSKFPTSSCEFIGKQWDKVKNSSTNLDRALEREYETLLREIDYLTCRREKSCLSSFENENYERKSAGDDLRSVLNGHSDEALKNFAENSRTGARKKTFSSRNSPVNYVTEIVVSRPKCDRTVCRCDEEAANTREVKKEQASGSNRIRTTIDGSSQSKKPGEVTDRSQTTDLKQSGLGPSGSVQIQTEQERHNSQVQTDHGDHDPNCSCDWCPKPTPPITTNTASAISPRLRDASTSHKKLAGSSKMTSASNNCTGDAITSTTRACLPRDFSPAGTFTMCNLDKKDCACDAYDAKEAVKRGLVLPGSEACIQTKNTSASSSDGDSKKVKNRQKKKEKKESSSDSSESSELKKKKNKSGCFGGNKKKGCDEYCQGIVRHEQSVQTLPVAGQRDKNEETAALRKHSADAGAQASSRQINEGHNRTLLMMDERTSHHADKVVDGKRSATSGSKEMMEKNGHEDKEAKRSGEKEQQESKEKMMNACNKCGRQKRDCVSGCRNTFIIPYASGSSRAIPAGDSESLRMLIKMQSKDTNRQIDTIMTEINHQKSEIRRLNDMYQKVVETIHETRKSISSYNQRQSDVSRPNDKRQEGSRSCGCTSSYECRMPADNKRKKSPTAAKSSGDADRSAPVRRYGPPNTAVAINMCDTCTVEIAANNTRSCLPRLRSACPCKDLLGGDIKERKEHVNQCKKVGQNLALKLENVNREGGDGFQQRTDSISTIYKAGRKLSEQDRRFVANELISRKLSHHDRQFKMNAPVNEGLINHDLLVTKKPSDHVVATESVRIKDESIGKIDVDVETDEAPRSRNPDRTYSSRVLLWLKKSWVSIRHKRDECKLKHEETRENAAKHMYDFCHSAAKHAAANAWKAAKRHKFFSRNR